jgi:hypothetical protein
MNSLGVQRDGSLSDFSEDPPESLEAVTAVLSLESPSGFVLDALNKRDNPPHFLSNMRTERYQDCLPPGFLISMWHNHFFRKGMKIKGVVKRWNG